MDVNELRKNAKVELDGHPYVVTDFQFVKPGKGQGLYKCKLKNMITGAVLDRTWRSGERLEAANVDTRTMQYLFAGADTFTFMDSASYEQVELSADLVGDDKYFLLDAPPPGSEQPIAYGVLFYNNRPVGLDVPSHVIMAITEAEPSVKGDTATNVTKGAKIQTGLEVQVPLFIKEGEYIKIDTRTKSYVERVNISK